MIKSKTQVTSPCTNQCALNDDDICVGCRRTKKEIGLWGSMKKVTQQAVIKKIRERKV
ncbi:DUF1289 domain-containing protein [Marinomonas sp.]|nr:DUF1289 domain-containing protein [Marinomonas sp.]MDB4837661.1 DUF1289 domain-containing protein [Marinomonas sp.]